ncbi:hypothetical protein EYF80_028891 [Liparis tanakae]|uniref:Uncharacterized protein n=1 Tax=Liparis tanakae TaxID=230148 RepID=A0A4Z2H5B3_9TELE|nr:hypothetical protein EYF80_028891 [Liparis tanakae]
MVLMGVLPIPLMQLLGGLILFSFCRRLQNQTRITSFSMLSWSAIMVISSEGTGAGQGLVRRQALCTNSTDTKGGEVKAGHRQHYTAHAARCGVDDGTESPSKQSILGVVGLPHGQANVPLGSRRGKERDKKKRNTGRVALTEAIWMGCDMGSWLMGAAAEAEMLAPVVLFCWLAECCTAAASS